MPRPTRSAATALSRLLEAWENTPGPRRIHTLRALAGMAELARSSKRHRVRSDVLWIGDIPTEGLEAWEREALEWLRWDR